MENIDIREVIGRLKNEMELESDADLAKKLDIERTYLGAMKSRGEFTGTAWYAIFNLCRKNSIDLNQILFGNSVKKQNHQKDNNRITLSPLKEIKDMINLSWLIRKVGVPKGTFMGWMRRNDNLLETKNDVPSHYRREVLYKLIFILEDLQAQINNVIQVYREKLKEIDK